MKYRSPYLIQRIEAATHSTPIPAGLAEKYARGEKRDEQERQWINGLMPLDYMGSAEFEWGAFGEAMKVMTAGKSSLVQFSLEIAGRPDSRDIVTKLSTVTVYCIAFAEHVEQVKRDVAVFAAKRPSRRSHWRNPKSSRGSIWITGGGWGGTNRRWSASGS